MGGQDAVARPLRRTAQTLVHAKDGGSAEASIRIGAVRQAAMRAGVAAALLCGAASAAGARRGRCAICGPLAQRNGDKARVFIVATRLRRSSRCSLRAGATHATLVRAQVGTLLLAEPKVDASGLASSTFNTLTAAQALGQPITALVAGQNVAPVAGAAASLQGVTQVRATECKVSWCVTLTLLWRGWAAEQQGRGAALRTGWP